MGPVPVFLLSLLPMLLIFVGLWLWSGSGARRHETDLGRRELAIADFFVTDVKTFPGQAADRLQTDLIVTDVVVGAGFQLSVRAALKTLIGGEVRGLSSLIGRSRREAVLRAIAEARDRGYNALCNLRIEMSSVGQMMTEVVVSGTAYIRTPTA